MDVLSLTVSESVQKDLCDWGNTLRVMLEVPDLGIGDLGRGADSSS